MIQGLTALMPILNKAIDLVPDQNKIAKQKADIEKELMKALVDVDKEQAKINRADAQATGALSWIQRLWRPCLAWVCVLAFAFQFFQHKYPQILLSDLCRMTHNYLLQDCKF